MVSALVIASRFIKLGIESDRPVTPMKLQKLIYMAHGIHLARLDKPLIVEKIEAWSYGPVIKSVYDMFKSWGNQSINEYPDIEFRIGRFSKSNLDVLTDEIEDTINFAWKIGKNLSGTDLSTWSHAKDSPWERSYSRLSNKPIPDYLIKEYFRDTMRIRPEA